MEKRISILKNAGLEGGDVACFLFIAKVHQEQLYLHKIVFAKRKNMKYAVRNVH